MNAYQDMVYSTAARLLGDRAQAEDISQDVFIRAYDHFEALEGSVTAGGWLKTVTRNLCLNHLSRYRKRWRFFSEYNSTDDEASAIAPEPITDDSALETLEAEERHAQVEAALASLPEHYRVPLVLYHFDALSYEEIASTLGVSLGKVKTDIHRGRLQLAARLGAKTPSHGETP
jgi:RNA polymerase sigma-70 factor (ECF subfamily)